MKVLVPGTILRSAGWLVVKLCLTDRVWVNRPKRTSDHERLHRWDSRYTLCFAGRSYSIDETAGTPSLTLAAVVTHSRAVVVCSGWASPENARLLCVLGGQPRNWQGSARWYQVHTAVQTGTRCLFFFGCSPILYVRAWYHTVVCRLIPGTWHIIRTRYIRMPVRTPH